MTLEQATGPIVESVSFSKDGKTATIKFKNVGEGLKTTDGEDPRGFLGCPAVNKPTMKVTAKITGKDTVEVTGMSEMQGVAYNAVSENYFGDEINLANSYGQPAGAFMLKRG